MCFDKIRKFAKKKDYSLLFFDEGERLFFCYTRYALSEFIESSKSNINIISCLTDFQANAFDIIHFVVVENSIELSQRKNDIHFINNRVNFHVREVYGSHFVDSKRHLMRFILMNFEFDCTLSKKLSDK